METRPPIILGFSLLLGGLLFCGIGVWQLFGPAEYRAEVRIIVQPDTSEIEEYLKNHPGISAYDPYSYFVEAAAEKIPSEAVLTNVVATLNLNDEWGKNIHGLESSRQDKRSHS